ncbi:MAG: slipin family protein [Candidatus Diapherotrites archaeon]|nr:slipin family protein [Candidatus Diapherotrites archaeon]
MVLELLIPLVILAFFLALGGIRILTEWERGVILRLGRYQTTWGPGIHFLIPIFQRLITVDMRIRTVDIPRQEVITKDNIALLVNAVVYFKVEKPADTVIKISDYTYALRQYAQGALRDVIGTNELDFVLGERVKISEQIKKIIDAETSEWGLDISSVKIQEIELPSEMKRAMAKQAEAERERRASVIISEGERAAATNLSEAAKILAQNPGALHLRTLRTIREIAADPSEKIVLFLPSEANDLIGRLVGKK